MRLAADMRCNVRTLPIKPAVIFKESNKSRSTALHILSHMSIKLRPCSHVRASKASFNCASAPIKKESEGESPFGMFQMKTVNKVP